MIYCNQKGMTIIESLVSLLLSGLLLTTLIAIFTGLYSGNTVLKHISKQLRELHFALHYIHSSIRQAGLNDCGAKKAENEFIEGYSAAATPPSFGIHAKTGSDVVVIRACIQYQSKRQYRQLAFFIGKTSRKNNNKPVYALFEKIISGNRLELAADIDDMKIQYGVLGKLQDEYLQYNNSSEVRDWRSVKSILLKFHMHLISSAPKLYSSIDDYIALRAGLR